MDEKSEQQKEISKKEDKNKEENNSIISTIVLPLSEKKFLTTISSRDNRIFLKADEELGIDPVYYETKLSFDDFISFGEMFDFCKDMKEIEKTFKLYIDKAMKFEMDYDISLDQKNDNELEINMKAVSEKNKNKNNFSIKLEKVDKDKEKVIENLRKIVDVCIKKIGKESIVDELKKSLSNAGDIITKYPMFWKEGPGYKLDKKRLVATRIDGEGAYATVVSIKPLPKNCISLWKIKLNNYESSCLKIGICPYNIDQKKDDNYLNSWTFSCYSSKLFLKSPNSKTYGSEEDIELKSDDIVGVKVDMNKGELSFSVNDVDYGIASNDIPTDIDIGLMALLDEGDVVELIA